MSFGIVQIYGNITLGQQCNSFAYISFIERFVQEGTIIQQFSISHPWLPILYLNSILLICDINPISTAS